MKKQTFSSVWDAIENTPAEAENMRLRSMLMTALQQRYENTTQTQAAKELGITQPRMSDLMRGKIHLFGLDALVNMAASAGLRIDLRVHA